MKKNLLLLLLLLSITIKSQTLVNSSIDFTGGYTLNGFGANANYNVIFDPSYIKLGLYISSSKEKTKENYVIPYNIISVNAGYFYKLIISNNQKIIFSAGAGVLAGYEVINNGSNELPNGALIMSKSNFIYGGFGSGEVEYGFTETFFLLLKGTEYYHLNSDLGSATFYGGIGIRIYLN